MRRSGHETAKPRPDPRLPHSCVRHARRPAGTRQRDPRTCKRDGSSRMNFGFSIFDFGFMRAANRRCRSIQNPKSKIQNLLVPALLLLITGCAAPDRKFEPVPSGWDRSGYEVASASVVALVVESVDGDAFGAGVIYDEQGHILTAHHVEIGRA